MAYTDMKNFAGPGKLVLWSTSAQPSLQEVLDTVKREFPDRPLSEIFVNDHLFLSEERPMYPTRR